MGRLAVHPRRAGTPVPLDPVPGFGQDSWVIDKVVEVIEPTTGVVDRPLVQLGLDLQYLSPGHIVVRPRIVGIHRRTPDIPGSALRTRCPPSPCTWLSHARTTTRTPSWHRVISRRRALPPPPWRGGGEAPDDSSHVHHAPVGELGAQLFPGSLATSTSQAFLVATWSTKASTSVSSCPNLRLDVRCCPAHIHQIGAGFHAYGGSSTDSLALHLPALLAGPRSSGSADPSRRSQGCSHLPLRLQVQAAPCFIGLLRQSQGGSFHPTRLMAPHGARSRLERRSTHPWPGRFF